MAVADVTPETCGLSQSVIDQVRAVFAGCPAVERAILYGSRAKGNYRHGSDIDLALEGQGLDDTQVLAMETRLDDLLLPYCIDLSRLAGIQSEALRDHIRRVGRVFYETGSALPSPLDGGSSCVSDGSAQQGREHGLEQPPTAPADVVRELKEPQVER